MPDINEILKLCGMLIESYQKSILTLHEITQDDKIMEIMDIEKCRKIIMAGLLAESMVVVGPKTGMNNVDLLEREYMKRRNEWLNLFAEKETKDIINKLKGNIA